MSRLKNSTTTSPVVSRANALDPGAASDPGQRQFRCWDHTEEDSEPSWDQRVSSLVLNQLEHLFFRQLKTSACLWRPLGQRPSLAPQRMPSTTEDGHTQEGCLGSTLTHIRACTVAEAHQQHGHSKCEFSVAELKAFIVLLYIRGAQGAKDMDVL